MNEPGSLRDELRALMWGLQSESLTARDMARLESLLKTDVALRREFIEYMGLISDLQFDAHPGMLEKTLARALSTVGTRCPPAIYAAPAETVPRNRSPVLGFLNGLLHVGNESPVASALTWLVMVVACSGVALTLFFCISLIFHGPGVKPNGAASEVVGTKEPPRGRIPQGRELAAAREGQIARVDVPIPHPSSSISPSSSSATVARLIHSAEARWVIGSHSPHLGDDLEPGRKLEMLSGLAEVMFQSGVRVIVEGPATMEIGSRTSTLLQRGKLAVRVEDPDARGFAVYAPGMKYTDLGTEFGVSVAKDGSQEMHVFRGKVQAEATAVGAEGGSEHPSSLTFSANQAVRIVAPGKPMAPIPVDEKQFVRVEQMRTIVALQSPEFRRWKAFHDELCKRTDLLAYYDFQPDESNPRVLRNRAATGAKFDGRLVGGAQWTEGRLPGKKAIGFHQSGSGVRIDIPVDCKQLTLLAWVNLDRLPEPRLRAILDSDTWHERVGSVHWQFRSDTNFDLDVLTAAGESVKPWTNAFRFPGALNQWGMFAATYDVEALRGVAYFDSKVVGRETLAKPTAARIGRATIGGFTVQPGGETQNSDRTLSGRIDELVIFQAELSADEIARIWDAHPF
jgi:hypothetical protein